MKNRNSGVKQRPKGWGLAVQGYCGGGRTKKKRRMAKGGKVRGGGAATRGLKFTRSA
jgi:hypothetical protein